MADTETNKRAAAAAALDYVKAGDYLGVGTGSTVNVFIELLGERRPNLRGCVASSEATRKRLRAAGLDVVELNETGGIDLYVDGADEINDYLQMIKGGGAALTREKVVASAARRFVCVADVGKQVRLLGDFPLPVEVIDMARSTVARTMVKLGGSPTLRAGVTTDNGHPILDVTHLDLVDPIAMEDAINAVPGVVTVGLFARRPADVALIAGADGVATLTAR